MTRTEARAKVEEVLRQEEKKAGFELAVVDELTIDRALGWVFFYTAKKYLETRDPKWEVGGNAPMLVDRRTGEVHVTGTAENVEWYIERYEKTGKCH
jgi:hypothetical protein